MHRDKIFAPLHWLAPICSTIAISTRAPPLPNRSGPTSSSTACCHPRCKRLKPSWSGSTRAFWAPATISRNTRTCGHCRIATRPFSMPCCRAMWRRWPPTSIPRPWARRARSSATASRSRAASTSPRKTSRTWAPWPAISMPNPCALS